MKLIVLATGVLGVGMLLTAGCSGSSFNEGSSGGGSAGTATGGNGSAGSSSSGGSASGGESTGGSAAGGSANGGSTSGGGSSGGASNGGATSGGVTTGGTNTGGVTTGGTNTGGAGGDATACNEDADCTVCAYPTAPQTADQCYCANCAFTPMSKTACMANQTDFAKVCANVHRPCPAIACVLPPTPVCKSHKCVAGQAGQ